MAATLKASEAQIQAACLEYLALRGYFYFRLNQAGIALPDGRHRSLPKHTPVGLPDAVLVKDGRFIGLEFKRSGASQSFAQVEVAKRILRAGADYHVIRSLDDLMHLGL
jgi:hypothetical protein